VANDDEYIRVMDEQNGKKETGRDRGAGSHCVWFLVIYAATSDKQLYWSRVEARNNISDNDNDRQTKRAATIVKNQPRVICHCQLKICQTFLSVLRRPVQGMLRPVTTVDFVTYLLLCLRL